MTNPSPWRQQKAASRRAPAALASMVPRLLGPTLRQRGFVQGEVLSHWPAIVGPLLARHTAPERVSFAPREAGGATLKIRVTPGFAPQIQHLEPLLIERLNTFYGYRAIARLRLLQGPLAPIAPPRRSPDRPLSQSEQKRLAKALAGLEEGPLRDALARLGQGLFIASEAANKEESRPGNSCG